MLVDTHAHLDYFDSEERPEIIARAREAGVEKIITIGTDVASSRAAVEIAAANPGIYAAVGIHPNEARALGAGYDLRTVGIAELANAGKVVAVGETGLDYHRMRSSKKEQLDLFEKHLELASLAGLPVIVHCRDAYDDLKTVFAAVRPERAVLHCFSGDPAEAETFLALGCHISFSGTVTFKNAPLLREAAALVPLDRLLVETDCPYLAPQPHRGQRNEPSYVGLVAQTLSQVKELPLEVLVKETSANADRLFCL